MSNKFDVPENIHCSKSHEYTLVEGNNATIGITDYAAEQLGEIVYVELPDAGASFQKGDVFGTVESVKAASEMYMPLSGTITEINNDLATEPELINDDPYGKGWIIKVSNINVSELEDTLSHGDYLSFVEE